MSECRELIECCTPLFAYGIQDSPTYFNTEQSYTAQCPSGFICYPNEVTVTIAAGAVSFTPGSSFSAPGDLEGCHYDDAQEYVNCLAYNQAKSQAEAQLSYDNTEPGSTFFNTEQTVNCPDGFSGGPFVVAANTYSSMVSQADANAIALAVAQSQADAGCVATCCIEQASIIGVGSQPRPCCAAPVSGAAGENYVFVGNIVGDTVSVIDALLETEITTIPVVLPSGFLYVPSVNKLYVRSAAGITIIDPLTLAVTGTVTLPGAMVPGDLDGRYLCLDPINGKAYFTTNQMADSDARIVSIDVVTDIATVIVTLPLGTPGADSNYFFPRPAFCTTTNKLYVIYQYIDFNNHNNDLYRLRYYTPAGTLAGDVILLDGSTSVGNTGATELHFIPQTGFIYQCGTAGPAFDFRVFDTATDTFIYDTIIGQDFGFLDFNPSCNVLVLHAGMLGDNLITINSSTHAENCRRAGGQSFSAGNQIGTVLDKTFVAIGGSNLVIVNAQ